MVARLLIRTGKPSNFDLLKVISEYSLDFANFKMEEHAEPAHVGRGVGVDWVEKETFETEAEMKAYCAENSLSRGRTNHNIGRRFTYLICAHDGCKVKMRLKRKLLEEIYVLEVGDGSEHQHNDLEIAPDSLFVFFKFRPNFHGKIGQEFISQGYHIIRPIVRGGHHSTGVVKKLYFSFKVFLPFLKFFSLLKLWLRV